MSTLPPLERASISKTPEDPESSTPIQKQSEIQTASLDYADPSPTHSDPFVTHKHRAWTQYTACCWSLFLAGWNDGSTGPLLPRIQEVYHVGFAVVSLIFISGCIGFVSGSIGNIWLTRRSGFGKTIVFGSFLQMIAYAIQSPALPFPVFAIAYAINGFGMSLQDAQANGYVASYRTNTATLMGIMHGVYGLGALCSPLAATQFAQIEHWSYHYLCSFGVALINTVILIVVFRLQDQDACLKEVGQEAEDHEKEAAAEGGQYRRIFALRTLHILAIFTLVYVGVEVTIGGWIVTYIINERGGGPSSGYISSGFFGGLAFGRVALLWLNKLIGERRAVLVYILIAIGLELVVWLVPTLLAGAISVSFVGMLLGPVYPIIMNESGRLLPRALLTGCIGWIAGLGQAGSALLPFMTGAIASGTNIGALQPLLVSMMGLLLVLWASVPWVQRTEARKMGL